MTVLFEEKELVAFIWGHNSQSDMEPFPVTWKLLLRAYNWLKYGCYRNFAC